MAGELSARIGSNFSDYQGNPQLGGSTAQVFNINTRPFENLAAYTFAYKTKLYDQKQKDLVARAKELASFTEYDLTNAVPKYGEQIRTKFSELKNWVVNNMDVLDYNNNPKGFLEYKKRRNELDNDIRDGKVQEILYAGATSAAEAETTPEMKAFILRQRDEQVAANDIRTPLVIHKYDVVKPITKAPPLKEFDITIQEGDFKADRKLQKIDVKSLNAQAFALGLGLAGDVLNENDPNFINLPEAVKKLKREEYKAKQSSGRLSTIDEAQTYNEALNNYKDAEGNIDLDKIKTNPILFPLIERFNRFNKYMIDEKANIKAGNYKDKGIALSFGMNGLDEADYQEVSFLDGITPEELLKVEIFSKAPPEKYETDVDATDNAFQRAQLDETIRNNKADQYLKSKDQKLNEDKWKASMTGGTTQINGAMTRAKRIYGDMLKLADKNGVITPDKMRQLNVEQLKYLGIEAADGAGFTPLTLEAEVSYGIQLVDGQVKVFKDAELLEGDKQGRIKGTLDPTKSTNLFNIGTNILNEELKNAGAKELNTYVGVDITGTSTSTTEGGSSSVSGTSKIMQSSSNIPSYSREQFKSAGWTDKQIEAALKAGKINIK